MRETFQDFRVIFRRIAGGLNRNRRCHVAPPRPCEVPRAGRRRKRLGLAKLGVVSGMRLGPPTRINKFGIFCKLLGIREERRLKILKSIICGRRGMMTIVDAIRREEPKRGHDRRPEHGR